MKKAPTGLRKGFPNLGSGPTQLLLLAADGGSTVDEAFPHDLFQRDTGKAAIEPQVHSTGFAPPVLASSFQMVCSDYSDPIFESASNEIAEPLQSLLSNKLELVSQR